MLELVLIALGISVPAFGDRALLPLFLSGSSGTVPFKVTVTGPPMLLEKAGSCSRSMGGVGFYVDWGDHSPIPGGRNVDCQKMLEHTFTVPGKYVVKAQTFHPGPTDAAVPDWRGDAPVEVLPGASVGFDIKIIDELKGKDFYFGSAFPPVHFSAETGRAAELRAELVSLSGTVLFAETKSVSFSGEDSVAFSTFGNGPLEGFSGKGLLPARLRLTLTAEGRSPVVRWSGVFRFHANATFRELSLVPEAGKAPLTVEASAEIFHPDCFSYFVDWGDGSKDASENFSPQKKCDLKKVFKVLKHTYKKAGHYVVRWHDNFSDTFHEAKVGPGYLEREVRISR